MNTFVRTSMIAFSIGLCLLMTSVTKADEVRHDGPAPALRTQVWEDVLKNTSPKPPTAAQQEIARVLSIAAQMQYVKDVMSVKEAGLVYVTNLSDLDYLTTLTVENPSEAYLTATAEFIATHVGTYIASRADIPTLIKLKGRIQTVSQAMSCNEAGLKVVSSVRTFLEILPFGVTTPSDEYRNQVSTFVADNIRRFVGAKSAISILIEIEKYTVLVTEAMAVKNAGLVAVKNKGQLLSLATFAFSNPTAAYQNAVSEFIKNNISRYP